MAGLFAADVGVARQLSSDLSSIRTSLTSLGTDLSGMHGQTGSSEVEAALDRFVRNSSDSRGNLDKLLERAIGLLNGLVDGTDAVDTALAQGLDPLVPSPSPSPTSAPASATAL
ncbi:hypothetical protein [Pseudofrankia asymbiotica]|uniref:Uncharacterized protein n=1 Tax=Pseudofrankia asymbiotica TaxID=1834516 RepID=A0A1V2I603_9ACTN|nr:hypothetical protein [Pseudofrankia asymbiotica]ONH26369.1 hypothetical protein BL253_24535 [Pseudofrankia asymbiotica]